MRSGICLYVTQETDMYGSDVRVYEASDYHLLCFDQSKKLSKMWARYGYEKFILECTIDEISSWGYGT